MEIGYVASELWRLRRWVALGLLVGLVAALSVLYELPSFEKKSYEIGAASTEVLVEPTGAPLGVLGTDPATAQNLVAQTGLYARLLGTAPVRERIRQESGVTAGPIAAGIPANLRGGRPVASEDRANELLVERNGYRILATPSPDLPVIAISTQAPNAEDAVRLADGAVSALRNYVSDVAQESGVRRRMRFRQLGPAVGGLVTNDADRKVAALAFVGAFAAWAFLVLVAARLRSGWREAHAGERRQEESLHIADTEPYEDGDDRRMLPSRSSAPAQRATS